MTSPGYPSARLHPLKRKRRDPGDLATLLRWRQIPITDDGSSPRKLNGGLDRLYLKQRRGETHQISAFASHPHEPVVVPGKLAELEDRRTGKLSGIDVTEMLK